MGEKYFVVSLSVHFIGLQTILQHENERGRAEPPAGGHSGAWRARQGGPCMHEVAPAQKAARRQAAPSGAIRVVLAVPRQMRMPLSPGEPPPSKLRSEGSC